jgi:hypothetical protein
MREMEMSITLTGTERSDGSYHITSEQLPGFHFILGPDEKPEDALVKAATDFLLMYYSAKLRQAKPVLKQRSRKPFSRKTSPFDMELCLA